MFERFTDAARRTVVLAQEHARVLKHDYIGTEHLLLGILDQGDSACVAVLQGMGVTAEAAAERVEAIVGKGRKGQSGHIPFTPRVKECLESAARSSIEHHDQVGPDRLLFALLAAEGGVVFDVLDDLGVDLQVLRQGLAEAVGQPSAASSPVIETDERPRMYGELAGWFHLLTSPADYADEAETYRGLLTAAADVTTVLELGSGGGNNASHLKAHFEMTLTDVSAPMLELSQRLNPGCEHIEADMRTLRLGRTFDAVFVHDAIDYMVTVDDLRAAIATAYAHLRPGGVALFCPDHLRDTFESGTDHGGHDEGEGDGGDRGLRYLEWTWDPDPADSTYVADYAFLLREGTGVRVARDRHVCGLFSRARWLEELTDAGFREVAIHPGAEGIEVFLGHR